MMGENDDAGGEHAKGVGARGAALMRAWLAAGALAVASWAHAGCFGFAIGCVDRCGLEEVVVESVTPCFLSFENCSDPPLVIRLTGIATLEMHEANLHDMEENILHTPEGDRDQLKAQISIAPREEVQWTYPLEAAV